MFTTREKQKPNGISWDEVGRKKKKKVYFVLACSGGMIAGDRSCPIPDTAPPFPPGDRLLALEAEVGVPATTVRSSRKRDRSVRRGVKRVSNKMFAPVTQGVVREGPCVSVYGSSRSGDFSTGWT